MRRELRLERVTLEAHAKRLVFVQRRERLEPYRSVSVCRGSARGHKRDVLLRGTMTRLAVDAQRRNVRSPTLRRTVEPNVDLAPVTTLAVREAWLVAKYALRRPIAAVGEREAWR